MVWYTPLWDTASWIHNLTFWTKLACQYFYIFPLRYPHWKEGNFIFLLSSVTLEAKNSLIITDPSVVLYEIYIQFQKMCQKLTLGNLLNLWAWQVPKFNLWFAEIRDIHCHPFPTIRNYTCVYVSEFII